MYSGLMQAWVIKEKMARSGDWELYILRKLEERNREEFHKHQEIYKACESLSSSSYGFPLSPLVLFFAER